MRHVSTILILIVFVGLFVFSQIGTALLQKEQSDHPQQSGKTASPSVSNSGQKPSSMVRNSPDNNLPVGWLTQCNGNGPDADCEVVKNITIGKAKQRLISIIVRASPGSQKPAMMLHLPVGLYLPFGVTFQVDGQKQQQLKVQSCDLQGCYAGTAVSTGMLSTMKTKANLTVTFQDLSRTTIRVPVSLEGFNGAYEKIPSIG
ncbi:MAG: invasion associated locus B family protein [Nitrospinota bacterium]|jgi:invasion protein IalB|nr:invasion associated locus B family protein [Nitrospinota bacterium]